MTDPRAAVLARLEELIAQAHASKARNITMVHGLLALRFAKAEVERHLLLDSRDMGTRCGYCGCVPWPCPTIRAAVEAFLPEAKQ